MYEYKSELVPIPYKLFNATLTEDELSGIDALINAKSYEGWELSAYTYLGGSNQIDRALLITFRREVC